MSEIKQGLYQFGDGSQAIVFYSSHDVAWFAVGPCSRSIREHWSAFADRKLEYLGPAVIGAENEEAGLSLACKVNSTLADRIRELEKDRDELRAKLVESLMDRTRLMAELDHLAETRCKQAVECAVDDDGIETYRFETVTVMRRDGKEAVVSPDMNGLSWYMRCGAARELASSENEAEEWCRQQLLPRWRPAKPEDADRKPECRVRASDHSGKWMDRTLIAHDIGTTNGPWVARDREGYLSAWPECEVQE